MLLLLLLLLLKVDDPVGAVGVHGVCGAFGGIMTGVFGEGCSFVVQLLGTLAVIVYVAVAAFIVFKLINKFVGLRVSEDEEIDGLDVMEHGCSAYSNFNFHNDK